MGNTHHTRVEGLTTCDFNKIVFADGDYFAGKQVSGNDSLYHASTSYTVLPFTGREEDDQTKTIEFASSHYDLFVEVVGIPAVGKRAGSLPVLEYVVSRLVPISRTGHAERLRIICLKLHMSPAKNC